jgi:hypothetical protein
LWKQLTSLVAVTVCLLLPFSWSSLWNASCNHLMMFNMQRLLQKVSWIWWMLKALPSTM